MVLTWEFPFKQALLIQTMHTVAKKKKKEAHEIHSDLKVYTGNLHT